MSLTDLSLAGLILILIATLVGITAFIWAYRPLDLRAHGPAGRHLLAMSWSLAALYTVSLAQLVVPIPLWLMVILSYLILGAICAVVWQRWVLLRRVRAGRHRDPVAHELDERG